jgi:hypothetical protein
MEMLCSLTDFEVSWIYFETKLRDLPVYPVSLQANEKIVVQSSGGVRSIMACARRVVVGIQKEVISAVPSETEPNVSWPLGIQCQAEVNTSTDAVDRKSKIPARSRRALKE